MSWAKRKKESIAAYDVVLMRKDPPFDMNFVYTTYVLEQAEREGAWIINKPQSLRDCNEKTFCYAVSRATSAYTCDITAEPDS